MSNLSLGSSRAVTTLRRFAADQKGATAVEYGLLVGALSVAIMGTIFSLGTNIRTTLYEKISSALSSM